MDIQTLKKATLVATELIKDLYPGCKNIQFEEFDYSDNDEWKITLSYINDNGSTLSFLNRNYKIITMNSSFDVLSIKIRNTSE